MQIFSSHNLDLLRTHLALSLLHDQKGPFVQRTIIVPSSWMKQWLLVGFVSQESIDHCGYIAGYVVYTLHEALSKLFPPYSRFGEIFAVIDRKLQEDEELPSYVKPHLQDEAKRVEIAYQLASCFLRYSEEDLSFDDHDWRYQFFKRLKFLSLAKEKILFYEQDPKESIHLFGFDFLPLYLLKAFSSFSSCYLFSPSFHFIEDLCSTKSKLFLQDFWKKKGVSSEEIQSFSSYVEKAPSLLANFGQQGRKMLKNLALLGLDVEPLDEDFLEGPYALQRVKKALLEFDSQKIEEADSSFSLIATGSLLFDELFCLKEEVLAKQEDRFSEMVVLAPDIQDYLPYIETIFHDIPYRIFGVEKGEKSFFYQGLQLLLSAEEKALVLLLENKAFLDQQEIVSPNRLKQFLEKKKGDEVALLEKAIFLDPENFNFSISWEELNSWVFLLQSFKQKLLSLKKEKEPKEWAVSLQEFVGSYLAVDLEKEEEVIAFQFFQKKLEELKRLPSQSLSFSWICKWFQEKMPKGEKNSHFLHALTFASLKEGHLIPTKHLFLMGVDEERFPRKKIATAFELFSFQEIDSLRYLLLQSLFVAEKSFTILYTDKTSHEGKKLAPSFLLEEIFSFVKPLRKEWRPKKKAPKKEPPLLFFDPKPLCENNPSKAFQEKVVSLQELKKLARDPWGFYLQKKYGFTLKKEEEEPFLWEKSALRKKEVLHTLLSLENPTQGLFGKVLQKEAIDEALVWKQRLKEWGVEPYSVELLQKKGAYETSSGRKIIGSFYVSEKGFVHLGEDSMEGLFSVWPECLVAASLTKSLDIYFVRSGKVRTLQESDLSLEKFLDYYDLAQSFPSPLLPALISSFVKGKEYEDPIDDPTFFWLKERACLPDWKEWFSSWETILQNSFSSLFHLYPQREK